MKVEDPELMDEEYHEELEARISREELLSIKASCGEEF